MKRFVEHHLFASHIEEEFQADYAFTKVVTKASPNSLYHLQNPRQLGKNLLRRKVSKPRHPRRSRIFDTTKRLANGSVNGDTRVRIKLVRTTGLSRLTRRRKESGRRVRRGRVMDVERGKRRCAGMRECNVRMRGRIGRITAGGEWVC